MLRTLVAFTIVFASFSQAKANNERYLPIHNFKIDFPDTLRYPLWERYGDPYSYPNRNGFDFRDTGFIKRSVEYDPKTNQYYIIEKIGDKYYRTPTAFTMEEFI